MTGNSQSKNMILLRSLETHGTQIVLLCLFHKNFQKVSFDENRMKWIIETWKVQETKKVAEWHGVGLVIISRLHFFTSHFWYKSVTAASFKISFSVEDQSEWGMLVLSQQAIGIFGAFFHPCYRFTLGEVFTFMLWCICFYAFPDCCLCSIIVLQEEYPRNSSPQ